MPINLKNIILRFAVLLTVITCAISRPLTSHAVVSENDKKLLIINSYNEAGAWSQEMIRPVMMRLAETDGVTAELVHLNAFLIDGNDSFQVLIEDLLKKHENNKPEYVVMIGSLGLGMIEPLREAWGDVPILMVSRRMTYGDEDVLFSENIVNYDSQLKPLSDLADKYNLTVVYVPDYYEETVDLMVEMQPEMTQLVFLADELFLNRILNSRIENYLKTKYPNISYKWVRGKESTSHMMRDYLVDTDPTIGLLLSTWFYQRTSLRGNQIAVTGDFYMLPSARHPVFTMREPYMNYGAIGGVFVDPESVQQAIDQSTFQLISGVPARKIPFWYPKSKHAYINYPVLENSFLNHKNVPNDVVYRDKPPTFWEQYMWQTITVLILLTCIFILLVIRYRLSAKKMMFMRNYFRLVSNMPIPYSEATVEFDRQGNVKDLHYHTSNTAFKQLLKENSTKGKGFLLFNREILHPYLVETVETGAPVSFIYHFENTNKYYEIIICRIKREETDTFNEKIINIDIFGIDITSRMLAEKTLQETATKLDLTISAARIIPWSWNLVENKIFCEAFRLFKRKYFHENNMVGDVAYIISEEEFMSHIHPEDVEKVVECKQMMLEGSVVHQKIEFRFVNEVNGEEKITWYEVNADVNKYDAEGHPSMLIGSMLNITDRKRQENALILAKDKAKESDKLKSAFLANMSHEIRTPLNAIIGFSNLMVHTQDANKREQFATIINDNNTLLLQIINDVLDLAKIESNTLEINYYPTDINELLKNIVASFEDRIPAEVRFNSFTGMHQCIVNIDPNRLSQVINNLLVNAIKFTEQGSITIGYELQGDFLRFEVRDTGIGIDNEDTEKLFQRFSKINSFAQGTGLGLSISKTIVNRLGGDIGVESRGRGQGSIFWFTIPYDAKFQEKFLNKETNKKNERDETRPTVNKNDVTVLIADDNESNYLLLESILEQDFKVLRAENGVHAVEMCKEFKPNIIVMDLNMPLMNGYKAAEEIRKFDKHVPIIAVTAYAMSTDRERVMSSSNFDSYMAKPIDSDSFSRLIRNMLNKGFILM